MMPTIDLTKPVCLNFTALKPTGKLKVRTPSKRYKAHGGARRWWAEVHDDNGLLQGKGSYGSREAAKAAAQEMLDTYDEG